MEQKERERDRCVWDGKRNQWDKERGNTRERAREMARDLERWAPRDGNGVMQSNMGEG